jgi:hypothetical protein
MPFLAAISGGANMVAKAGAATMPPDQQPQQPRRSALSPHQFRPIVNAASKMGSGSEAAAGAGAAGLVAKQQAGGAAADLAPLMLLA